MAIEIVDLPINSMVVFHSYVSLPEGMWTQTNIIWYSNIPLQTATAGSVSVAG